MGIWQSEVGKERASLFFFFLIITQTWCLKLWVSGKVCYPIHMILVLGEGFYSWFLISVSIYS